MRAHRYAVIALALIMLATVGSAALMDGLIAGWTFDDGTARDVRGRSDGVVHGDVQFVEGRNGLGADISGVGAYIEIPHHRSMDAMGDEFTHALWALVRRSGDHAGLMFKGELIGWGPYFHIRLATLNDTSLTYGSNTVAGHVRGEIEPGAKSAEGWFNAGGVYKAGEWIHVAQVGTGRTIQAFLNGAPVKISNGFGGATGTDPIPLTAPYDVFPDYPLEIGISRGQGGNRDTVKSIDGIIDEVAIFRRALSATEIAQLGDFDWSTAVRAEGKLATTWATIRNSAGL